MYRKVPRVRIPISPPQGKSAPEYPRRFFSLSAYRSWYMNIGKGNEMNSFMRTVFIAALLAAGCSRVQEGSKKGECGDAIDNDGDGKYDCEDEGCIKSTTCVELMREAERARKETAVRQNETSVEEPQKEKKDEKRSYFEIDNLYVQKGHNGNDIDQRRSKEYCDTLTLEGISGWRLPEQKEAVAIFKSSLMPAEPYVMWTSTTKGNKTGVIVGITSGAVNELGSGYKGQCRARCVRDAR